MKQLSLIILILGMIISLFLSINSYHIQTEKEQIRFDATIKRIVLKLEDRMKAYKQVLSSGVGLFEASEEVSRQEWAIFVKKLDVDNTFPGIQGIGYSIVLHENEIEEHIKKIRTEGFKDYKIKPEGEREFYTSIIYLEPFDIRNIRAFGYDMYSESVRREAMNRAILNNEAALSGKVRLVQENGEDEQAGFLLYLPIYKQGYTLNSEDERVSAIQGFVYSPFRAKNFMNGVVDEVFDVVNLRVYDGEITEDEYLLFDSNTNTKTIDALSNIVKIQQYGRVWTLEFKALDVDGETLSLERPLIVLIIGLILSTLLSALVFSLFRTKERASHLAQKMTENYSKTSQRLELITENIEEGLYVTNTMNKIISINYYGL